MANDLEITFSLSNRQALAAAAQLKAGLVAVDGGSRKAQAGLSRTRQESDRTSRSFSKAGQVIRRAAGAFAAFAGVRAMLSGINAEIEKMSRTGDKFGSFRKSAQPLISLRGATTQKGRQEVVGEIERTSVRGDLELNTVGKLLNDLESKLASLSLPEKRAAAAAIVDTNIAVEADVGTIKDALAGSINIFPELKDKTFETLRFLDALANASPVDFTAIAPEVTGVAAVAKKSGVGYEESLIAFATMVGKTGSVAEATTELQQAMKSLAGGTAASAKMMDNLGLRGLSFSEKLDRIAAATKEIPAGDELVQFFAGFGNERGGRGIASLVDARSRGEMGQVRETVDERVRNRTLEKLIEQRRSDPAFRLRQQERVLAIEQARTGERFGEKDVASRHAQIANEREIRDASSLTERMFLRSKAFITQLGGIVPAFEADQGNKTSGRAMFEDDFGIERRSSGGSLGSKPFSGVVHGTPGRDRVPAVTTEGRPLLVEDGEFVVSGEASRKNRPLLRAINAGVDVERLAGGGSIGQAPHPYSATELRGLREDANRPGIVGDDARRRLGRHGIDYYTGPSIGSASTNQNIDQMRHDMTSGPVAAGLLSRVMGGLKDFASGTADAARDLFGGRSTDDHLDQAVLSIGKFAAGGSRIDLDAAGRHYREAMGDRAARDGAYGRAVGDNATLGLAMGHSILKDPSVMMGRMVADRVGDLRNRLAYRSTAQRSAHDMEGYDHRARGVASARSYGAMDLLDSVDMMPSMMGVAGTVKRVDAVSDAAMSARRVGAAVDDEVSMTRQLKTLPEGSVERRDYLWGMSENGVSVEETAFLKDGVIYRSGGFHNISLVPGGFTQSVEDGFVTNTGDFLSRRDAGVLEQGGGILTGESLQEIRRSEAITNFHAGPSRDMVGGVSAGAVLARRAVGGVGRREQVRLADVPGGIVDSRAIDEHFYKKREFGGIRQQFVDTPLPEGGYPGLLDDDRLKEFVPVGSRGRIGFIQNLPIDPKLKQHYRDNIRRGTELYADPDMSDLGGARFINDGGSRIRLSVKPTGSLHDMRRVVFHEASHAVQMTRALKKGDGGVEEFFAKYRDNKYYSEDNPVEFNARMAEEYLFNVDALMRNGRRDKFHDGGVIGYTNGGLINGPPGRDRVPAVTTGGRPLLVEDKEFVVNAAATRENLPLLQAMNSGRKIQRLTDGGPVGGVSFGAPPLSGWLGRKLAGKGSWTSDAFQAYRKPSPPGADDLSSERLANRPRPRPLDRVAKPAAKPTAQRRPDGGIPEAILGAGVASIAGAMSQRDVPGMVFKDQPLDGPENMDSIGMAGRPKMKIGSPWMPGLSKILSFLPPVSLPGMKDLPEVALRGIGVEPELQGREAGMRGRDQRARAALAASTTKEQMGILGNFAGVAKSAIPDFGAMGRSVGGMMGSVGGMMGSVGKGLLSGKADLDKENDFRKMIEDERTRPRGGFSGAKKRQSVTPRYRKKPSGPMSLRETLGLESKQGQRDGFPISAYEDVGLVEDDQAFMRAGRRMKTGISIGRPDTFDISQGGGSTTRPLKESPDEIKKRRKQEHAEEFARRSAKVTERIRDRRGLKGPAPLAVAAREPLGIEWDNKSRSFLDKDTGAKVDAGAMVKRRKSEAADEHARRRAAVVRRAAERRGRDPDAAERVVRGGDDRGVAVGRDVAKMLPNPTPSALSRPAAAAVPAAPVQPAVATQPAQPAVAAGGAMNLGPVISGLAQVIDQLKKIESNTKSRPGGTPIRPARVAAGATR